MNNIYIQLLVESVIIFVGIFLFNYFGFVRKNKKLKKDNLPLELIYLASLYTIEPSRLNFRRFQYVCCFVNAFIITTTYIAVTYLIKIMLLKVIVGIVLLIVLIVVCYGFVGRYYFNKEIDEDIKKKK